MNLAGKKFLALADLGIDWNARFTHGTVLSSPSLHGYIDQGKQHGRIRQIFSRYSPTIALRGHANNITTKRTNCPNEMVAKLI